VSHGRDFGIDELPMFYIYFRVTNNPTLNHALAPHVISLQILLLSIFNKFLQVQYLDKIKIDFKFFIDCQTIHTLTTTKLAHLCFIKIQHEAKLS
jgi:hypothetical protein